MSNNVKTCLQCGAEYLRRYGLSRTQFAKQKYCSNACAGEARRKAPGEKRVNPNTTPRTCELCGKAYYKTPTVTRAEWQKRRYCSRTCAGKLNVTITGKKITNNNSGRLTNRQRARIAAERTIVSSPEYHRLLATQPRHIAERAKAKAIDVLTKAVQ